MYDPPIDNVYSRDCSICGEEFQALINGGPDNDKCQRCYEAYRKTLAWQFAELRRRVEACKSVFRKEFERLPVRLTNGWEWFKDRFRRDLWRNHDKK